MFKTFLIILILASWAWSVFMAVLTKRQHALPLPENVRGIYDDEGYRRFLAYSDEKTRFGLLVSTFDTALLLIFFGFDLFSAIARLLPQGPYLNPILLMGTVIAGSTLLSLPLGWYDRMHIEEKYGFNTATGGTFAADSVKSLLLSLVLSMGFTALCVFLWSRFGTGFIPFVYALVAVFSVVVSTFYMTFSKLFNRYTPLEDGSLRDRLVRLFESRGFNLKAIYVMDASRRSTRANAFCAGLGKFKQIALYDTLVNHYSEDEIVAIFAHELSHFEHRDTLKMTLIELLLFAPAVLILLALVSDPALLASVGFAQINMAMVFIIMKEALLGPLLFLCMIPLNAYSRRCEYRADRGAVAAGMGGELIASLKKLSRDDFADLNPHPLKVRLSYSHPPMAARIAAIEAAEKA